MNRHAVNRTFASDLGRSLIAAGSGPIFSQALTIIFVPVLFRLYTPHEFGLWASVQAFAIVAGSLACLRFDLALVLERDLTAASQLLFGAALIVVGFSLLAALVMVLSSPLLQKLGISPLTATLGWVWLLLIGLGIILQSWMLREGAFADVSVATVFQGVTTQVVQIAGGLFGGGMWLIVGSIAGHVAVLGYYVWNISRTVDRPLWHKLRIRPAWLALAKNRRFPQLSLPFTAMSLLRERGPIFLIGGFGTPAMIGLYSQAWRLTHFPAGLVGAAFRPVFFHRVATAGILEQGESVDRIVCLLLLASGPWIGFVAYGNEELFTLFLGAQWAGAGQLGALLVVPAGLFTITNWMDRLMDAIGRQDINLKAELIAGLGSTGVLGSTLAFGGSLILAVSLQSIVLTLTYAWFLWVCYRVAGWSRKSLTTSLIGACAGVTIMLSLLTALGAILSSACVLTIGAAIALLTTVITAMLRKHGWE